MFDKIILDWMPYILFAIFCLTLVWQKRNLFMGLVYSAMTAVLSFRLLHYELTDKVDKFFNITLLITSFLVATVCFVLYYRSHQKG